MTLPASRRGLLLGAGALTAATLTAARGPAQAQAAAPAATLAATPPAAGGPFTLPPLPYATNANEAAIDAMTMELHHDKHHAAYVKNLNDALAPHPDLAAMPLETLLQNLTKVHHTIRRTVRNNAGGHANHSMFWEVMGGQGGQPTGALKTAVDRDLGGYDKMVTEFNGNGAKVFGSGWVFVTVTRAGTLAITSKPNQDTPVMQGNTVLFGNDMWEHAYYLRYQNRRPEYLANWWKVVNWEKVAARYEAAKAGTLKI